MSDKNDEVREWTLYPSTLERGWNPVEELESIRVIEYSAYDALKAERDELIIAHDTQVKIAKDFQKLFIEVELEMSKLTEQNNHLRQLLNEARNWIERANFSAPMSDDNNLLTKLNKELGE